MRGIRSGGAGPIKMLQTKVDDDSCNVAITICRLRSGAAGVETAWMLLTIAMK
jgi:hypothetical protein